MTTDAHLPADQPRSYWHATAPPPIPSDDLPATSEVVVVGGGMLGVWTTYWLAKAGMQPTLIERSAISWGATGRNGGLLRAGLADGFANTVERVGEADALAIWRISQEGRNLVPGVIEAEGIDCHYKVVGSIHLWLDEATMAKSMGRPNPEGDVAIALDRQALREHILTPLGPEIVGGMYFPDGARLHSSRYLAGVAAAARRHGARLCLADVQGLTADGDDTLIATNSGTVRAHSVIVAVNAWSDELVPSVSGVIKPVRGQVLSYAPIPPTFNTSVGVAATPTGEYWQQTADGSVVLGGYRAVATGQDVNVREMVPTDEVQEPLAGLFPRLFPQLDGLNVERRWAGLMAFTPDYLPVADRIPGLARGWFAGGFCGHGMPYGPRIGQLLAEAAASGETPTQLAPLRASRPSLAN